jgi:hypothetical protein
VVDRSKSRHSIVFKGDTYPCTKQELDEFRKLTHGFWERTKRQRNADAAKFIKSHGLTPTPDLTSETSHAD